MCIRDRGESLAAGLAADQLRAGGDVAPLVGAAELQFTTYGFVQVQEVVGPVSYTHLDVYKRQ